MPHLEQFQQNTELKAVAAPSTAEWQVWCAAVIPLSMWTPAIVPKIIGMLTWNISDDKLRHSMKLMRACGVGDGEILIPIYNWSWIQTQKLFLDVENTNHITIINKWNINKWKRSLLSMAQVQTGISYKTYLLSCPCGNCSIGMKDLTASRLEKLCWF